MTDRTGPTSKVRPFTEDDKRPKVTRQGLGRIAHLVPQPSPHMNTTPLRPRLAGPLALVNGVNHGHQGSAELPGHRP